MRGNVEFALIFIAVAAFAPLIGLFLEYGIEALANKLIKYIDTRNEKKEDI